METKQTAVEWYSIQEIDLTIQVLEGKIGQIEYAIKRVGIAEQAKQMEKEQIIDAVSGSLPDDNRIVTEAILAARKIDSDVGLLPSNQDIKMFCLGAKWMRDKILNK